MPPWRATRARCRFSYAIERLRIRHACLRHAAAFRVRATMLRHDTRRAFIAATTALRYMLPPLLLFATMLPRYLLRYAGLHAD